MKLTRHLSIALLTLAGLGFSAGAQAQTITWVKQVSPPRSVNTAYFTDPCKYLYAVVRNPATGITVTGGCRGTLAYSMNNGVSWTRANIALPEGIPSLGNADIRDIELQGGTWVAITGRSQHRVADNRGGHLVFVLTSTDGINWTANELTKNGQFTGQPNNLRAVAGNTAGTCWVAGTHTGRILKSSSPSSSWTTSTVNGVGTVTSVAFFNGFFYMAINDGNPAGFLVKKSTDACGTAWDAGTRLAHKVDRLKPIGVRLYAVGENRGISSITTTVPTWVVRHAADTTGISLKDIINGDGNMDYVGFGELGEVYRSANGNTGWATTTKISPAYLIFDAIVLTTGSAGVQAVALVVTDQWGVYRGTAP